MKTMRLCKEITLVICNNERAKGLEKMASSKDDKLHWHTSFDVDTFASKEMKNSTRK